MSDVFDTMTKADLATFLAWRGPEPKASATRAELQALCREAAIRATMRHREPDVRVAMLCLRGANTTYSIDHALRIVGETTEDAIKLAEALGHAQQQLKAARGVIA